MALQELLGRGQPGPFQGADDQGSALGAGPADAMHQHRLGHGVLDTEPGIQGLVRILVDHLQFAAQRAHLLLGQPGDVGAVQPDASRRGVHHPQDGLRGAGLAAA
jgi:hypothetical protein